MAFLLLILLVSSALVSSALGTSKLLLNTHLPPSSEIDSYQYCDRDYSCLNCSTVRVCAPTPDGQNLYEIDRFTCSSSSYPYCNYTSGSCSSSPDPACYNTPNTTVSTNFTCMRDGYYPDPYNCSLYYYCENEVAYQYACVSPLPYYHPQYQYCVAYNYYCTDRTTSYLCQYNSYYGRKIPISYTNNYFLYCGVYNKIMAVDRCIGSYVFDSSAQACRFNCPSGGLFLKNDDCTHYYKCTPKPYGGYIVTERTCPEGQGFLESEYSCVNRSHVPNCNRPYPDLFSK